MLPTALEIPVAPCELSARSKYKLQAYRYSNQNEISAKAPEDLKLLGGVKTKPVAGEQGNESYPPHPTPRSQISSQNMGPQVHNECPQTPVGRLPLAELIANGEDLNQTLTFTPVERVLWGNSARTSDRGSSQETPLLPRSRKRAYSSSPASSSQKKRVLKQLTVDQLSAQNHSQPTTSKTPQGDPASDLWNRYSLDIKSHEKRSPTKMSDRSFLQSMNSSSPQQPVQVCNAREPVGLRRSFSCSMEWPTSAAKRRKLQHDLSHHRQALPIGSAAAEQPTIKSQKSRSRLSLLVDKIHDDLARPPVDNMDSFSASAIKSLHSKTQEPMDDPLGSPERPAVQKARTSSDIGAFQNQNQGENAIEMSSHLTEKEPHHSGSHSEKSERKVACEQLINEPDAGSDFGDDDLDLEMLEALDAPVYSVQPIDMRPRRPESRNGKPNPMPKLDCEGDHVFNSVGHAQILGDKDQLRAHSVVRHATFGAGQDNEFDDDAEDVSAEDLEDAIASFNSQRNADCKFKPSFREDPAVSMPPVIGITRGSQAEKAADKALVKEVVFPSEISSDDEFGGDAEFEDIIVESDEAVPRLSAITRSQSTKDISDSMIQRYVIMTIAEGEYHSLGGQSLPEKVLFVKDDRTKLSKAISLRQSWFDTPCSQGAYIHLIGQFDHLGQCIVDDSQNLLILHPDYLISATVVADSFSCTRRAVLQDRVKATGDPSEPQVYGSMLHEVFQEAISSNRWDDESLTRSIELISARYLEKLFEIGVEVPRAVDHMKSRVVEMQAWAEIYVGTKPKARAVVRDRNGAQMHMSVSKLLDVEEKIWSPKYGLKGMIDATVQITIQNETDGKHLIVPLEVKTGKNPTAAHRAQTALYTVLCSDRYDLDVTDGILYYMETSETSRILAVRHELIHMIQQRNELAVYIRHKLELPSMLKDSPHLCAKCYAQTACFIYHKLVDDANGESNGLREMFDELVKHLNPAHRWFFTKWDNLLTKEENDMVKFRRELWTLQSSEREKLGRCFGKVIIEAGSYAEVADASKINRHRYNFVKQKPQPGFSFTESQMTLGEPIVISDERGHFALASGYVTNVRKHKLQVAIDRRLHNAQSKTRDFDSHNNESSAGMMDIVQHEAGQVPLSPCLPQGEVLYRIDKDEFSNGMATIRNNLIMLMDKDAFNANPLRRLIVENVKPTFRPLGVCNVPESACQANLNVDQKRAIEKVMSAKDYALVLGMPGTGKTTTIAHIIRALAAQGKSILLTSYTHTAVDNILLKIRKDKIGIFRLGAVAKVHPDVQEFADLGGVSMKTVEELKRAYGQQIVATTCLGINHPIFNQRIFDYCIVDEASQITLPVCLGPIRMARTFILVGDHHQLPPLVQNKEAQEGGLDISLFKILSDNQPSSVVNLEHQYRMCEDIMTLSNNLIYNGRLRCGTMDVASRSLMIPNMDALKQHHNNKSNILLMANTQHICQSLTKGLCWLRDLLDPSVKACFVNTDPLLPASREAETGCRITNPFEATLCQQLVESLITTGVSQTDIGVITLYRSQLALIKHGLRHRTGVEMHTADKFQGRDKEVVVLSLVRSNDSGNVGELLKDWRRVNVAFTRARTKLLVLGSKKTLEGNELLKEFVQLTEHRSWSYDLPPGALEGHLFDDGATQISADRSSGVSSEQKTLGGKPNVPVRKDNTHLNVTKMSRKRGTIDIRRLLEKRPVLKDIVNDAC
ncbi:MAG: hypothetical protein Q9195_006269 [Heterodermia aff. obscurata]